MLSPLPTHELLREHHFTPNPLGAPGLSGVGTGPGQALGSWQRVLLCL